MLGLEISCPLCNGQKKVQCKTCNGTGKLRNILGFIPKYCPNCNKSGFINCVCFNEGNRVNSILGNPNNLSHEQKEIVVGFFKNYDPSFAVHFMEQYLLANSVEVAKLMFELLEIYGWTAKGSENKSLQVRYALIKMDKEYMHQHQNKITDDLLWYVGDYANGKKNAFVIDLIMQLNNDETLGIIELIVKNSHWPDLLDKHNEIIMFLLRSDNGLELLVDICSTNSYIFDSCLRIHAIPNLLKAIGRVAFRVKITPNKEINKDNIIKVLFYFGLKTTQEAIDISKELTQNKYSYSSSLYSLAADFLVKKEGEVDNLVTFIIDKKQHNIDAPEIGLLNALSAYGDGGESLLNTVNETPIYDDALRATNYLDYMVTYRKDILSQHTLSRILKLEYREFRTGGVSSRYMPGAFGGSYTTSSSEKCDIISFKHILKKI